MDNEELKCVILKGDLKSWGKHILMPIGATLCGQPTVDMDKEKYPQLKDGNMASMINEYTVEKWDITCKKCLEVIEIVKKSKEKIN